VLNHSRYIKLLWIGFITIIPALIRMFTTDLFLASKRVYGKAGSFGKFLATELFILRRLSSLMNEIDRFDEARIKKQADEMASAMRV